MNLKQVLPSGEEHGLINSVGNSVQGDGFQHMKPDVKAKAEKLKKHNAEIVKARYLNSRGGRETMERPWCLGAGEPIQMWKCIHDHIYDIPRGLIDDVNRSPGLAKRSEVLDAQGVPTKKDGAPEKLHQFVPVTF